MSTIKVAKIASVVLALHLIALGFFLYKPPAQYFVVICLSTLVVWSVVFSKSRRKMRVRVIVGLVVQLAIQQVAFQAWPPERTSVWWPLVQFLALQYVIAVRLGSSPDDT